MDQMTTRVFISQDVPKLNLTPAKAYAGEFVVILPPGEMTRDLKRTISNIKHKLSDFQRGDYLLLIGDPIVMGLTLAIALNMADYSLKVLRWDRQEKVYDCIFIPEVK
jgi:hypothetical protein